eukprot:641483-Prymnesium_polylepis.1
MLGASARVLGASLRTQRRRHTAERICQSWAEAARRTGLTKRAQNPCSQWKTGRPTRRPVESRPAAESCGEASQRRARRSRATCHLPHLVRAARETCSRDGCGSYSSSPHRKRAARLSHGPAAMRTR